MRRQERHPETSSGKPARSRRVSFAITCLGTWPNDYLMSSLGRFSFAIVIEPAGWIRIPVGKVVGIIQPPCGGRRPVGTGREGKGAAVYSAGICVSTPPPTLFHRKGKCLAPAASIRRITYPCSRGIILAEPFRRERGRGVGAATLLLEVLLEVLLAVLLAVP